MNTGICRLCNRYKELCDSHAMPNSAFRLLVRESSGKGVVITSDLDMPVHYSSDSWAVPLLCQSCEETLNEKYDQYGVGILKAKGCKVLRGLHGITFKGIDRHRLRMFCLSVLWRVSVSDHISYTNIDLPELWESQLRYALYHGGKMQSSSFVVCIYRLRDSTPASALTVEGIRSFIVAPFGRGFNNGQVSICFVCFGFLFEIFATKLPRKLLNKPGVIAGSSSILLAPYLEIMAVPELLDLITIGIQKHMTGNSRVD